MKELTQAEIIDWMSKIDRVIDRRWGLHNFDGSGDLEYTVEHTGNVYNIGCVYTPWEDLAVFWCQPELKSHGIQLEFNFDE
jgi:hypothetical protein